jgi:hypothetical protein
VKRLAALFAGPGPRKTGVKQIVCLANSRKRDGRCVAGKERTANGYRAWIRPISERKSGSVSEWEQRCQDGTDTQLLDVIEVSIVGTPPTTYQSENWQFVRRRPWKRVDRVGWDELPKLADDPDTLWLNGDSSAGGVNDRVAFAATDELRTSLYLLRLDDLALHVSAPRVRFGDSKRRVQASFTHRGVGYRFWVTDFAVEDAYRAGPDGDFPIGECFATVSLADPYEGYCYKLVAALMIPGSSE